MRAEIQIPGFTATSDAWSELCNLNLSDSLLRWGNVKTQLGEGIVHPACACRCGSVSETCNSWKQSRDFFFLLIILGIRNNKFCFTDHQSKIWGLTVLFNRNKIKSSYLCMKIKCYFHGFMRVIWTKLVKVVLDHLFGMYPDRLRMRSSCFSYCKSFLVRLSTCLLYSFR